MSKKDPLDDIEMITDEPLMTEEGFLNPACMNAMEAAFRNSPKTYDRLSRDREWNGKKDRWVFRSYIVGSFAKYACSQSPYGMPEGQPWQN